MRQIVVRGDGFAKPRKIREGGVRGERKNEQNRSHRQVVENSLAEDGRNQHGKQALVAGLAGVGGGDAINLYEIRDSGEQQRQQKNNDCERALRVLYGGFAEGFHAVADGLDAGERRAAARKHFQEQPEADGLRHGRRRRQRRERHWMSAGEERAHQTARDRDEQCANEKVRGHDERTAGFADSPEIDDRDDEENADADRDCVRQQRRHCGNQRANACGNAHRGGKNVVGQQSCRSQQAREGAKIVARDCV